MKPAVLHLVRDFWQGRHGSQQRQYNGERSGRKEMINGFEHANPRAFKALTLKGRVSLCLSGGNKLAHAPNCVTTEILRCLSKTRLHRKVERLT